MLLSAEDRRSRACSELRRGSPIVMTLQGQSAVIVAAETMTQATMSELQNLGLGAPTLALTDRRAAILRVPAYDQDLVRLEIAPNYSLRQIKAIADPALALDFPMVGPFKAVRSGEAHIHRAAIALCKRARLLPCAIVYETESPRNAQALRAEHDLAWIDAAESFGPDVEPWKEVVSARVPISVAPSTRLRIFRRQGWDDEHYAVEIGEPDRHQPVLTRLHSACVTGDLFSSLKCDCGPQLNAALAQIAKAGSGVLIYLLQEGRGIGLANKMRAYRLQDEGFDTVEANHRLGFQDDERLLTDGGEILRQMGFRKARLMTNNPRKMNALEKVGIEVVERVPVITALNAENENYLATKKLKSGHLL
ncbi:MAG: GTP cyclohydrolase II [Neomegalonema sp.]|nr:GTP cyclohydrolase II [Neomegalonema sp.]